MRLFLDSEPDGRCPRRSAAEIHPHRDSTAGRFGGDNRPRTSPRFGPGESTLSQDEIATLLADVSRGDRAAFERLYRATCAKVYGVVLRIVRRHELALTVMEEAYEQVWHDAGQFDAGHCSPVAWVVAIARSRAIDLARAPAASDGEPEAEIADSVTPGAMPRREIPDELKRVLTCIGRLDPERQRMILLAYYGAFTRDQLAIKLDMPTNLLTTALRRSLFEIEQCLTT